MSPSSKKRKGKGADAGSRPSPDGSKASLASSDDQGSGEATGFEGSNTDVVALSGVKPAIKPVNQLNEQNHVINGYDSSKDSKMDDSSAELLKRKVPDQVEVKEQVEKKEQRPPPEDDDIDFGVYDSEDDSFQYEEEPVTDVLDGPDAMEIQALSMEEGTDSSTHSSEETTMVRARSPIRAPSPEPMQQEQLPDGEMEEEDLEEIMNADHHKYESFYHFAEEGEEKPKDPRRKAVARETSTTIQAFRKYTYNIRNTPYESPDALPQSLQDNKFVVVPSSKVYALYMVLDTAGGSYMLSPIHREVVADDRPDLFGILLDDSAYDTASGRNFDMTDVVTTDIIFVEAVTVRPKAIPGEYIKKISEAGNIMAHKYWKVARCSRLIRDALHNETGIHIPECDSRKSKSFLVNNVAETAVAHISLFAKRVDLSTFVALDVVRPIVQPGKWLPGFKPPFEEEDKVLKKVQYHLDLPHILPVVTRVYELDKKRAEILDKAPNVFTEDMEPVQSDFLQLQNLTKLGIFGAEAMASAYYDAHKFYGRVLKVVQGKITEVFIRLQLPEGLGFAKTKWRQGTRLSLRFETCAIKAVLLSITVIQKTAEIRVKPLRRNEFPFTPAGAVNQPVFAAHMLENPRHRVFRLLGVKSIPKYKDWMPAMKALVAIHGGSPPPAIPKFDGSSAYEVAGLMLTEKQGAVLRLLESEQYVAATLSCGPGSGKTTTIVSAMVRCTAKEKGEFAVFTGNSNAAVTQGVTTLLKLDPKRTIPAVRLISNAHRQVVDESALTEIDFPALWPSTLKNQVMEEDRFNGPPRQYTLSAVKHLKRSQLISKKDLRNKYLREAISEVAGQKPEPPVHSLLETFFRILKPKVVLGTADTLRQTFKNESFLDNWKHLVRNVIIDEASQVGHHVITNLAFAFPRGKLLLVGDERQLPPFSEHAFPSKLYKIHCGPVFSQIVGMNLLPNYTLNTVYRCPEQSVKLISDLYYGGKLRAAKKAEEHCKVLKVMGLPDRTPTVVINTRSKERKEGTSWSNQLELEFAVKLAERFLATPELEGKTMAIVSYYLAQVQEVAAKAPNGVTVASVDAVQGKEFHLVVLLTTRSQQFSEFMRSAERFTVAASRHQDALIVLANTPCLLGSPNWKALLDSTAKTSILDATAIPFLRSQPGTSLRK